MSHKPLTRLSFVSDETATLLMKQGLHTCGDVVQCTVTDILSLLPALNRFEASTLLETVAKEVAPSRKLGLDMWEEWQTQTHAIRTQIPILDGVLHDGIPLGSITEVSSSETKRFTVYEKKTGFYSRGGSFVDPQAWAKHSLRYH